MGIREKIEQAAITNWLSADMDVESIKEVKELARISAKIQMKRNELGMNQKQFAKALGVSQGMVSKWESGEYNFTISALSVLCSKLNMDFRPEIRENAEEICGETSQLKFLTNKVKELKIGGDGIISADSGEFGLDMCLSEMNLTNGRRVAQLLMRVMA